MFLLVRFEKKNFIKFLKPYLVLFTPGHLRLPALLCNIVKKRRKISQFCAGATPYGYDGKICAMPSMPSRTWTNSVGCRVASPCPCVPLSPCMIWKQALNAHFWFDFQSEKSVGTGRMRSLIHLLRFFRLPRSQSKLRNILCLLLHTWWGLRAQALQHSKSEKIIFSTLQFFSLNTECSS